MIPSVISYNWELNPDELETAFSPLNVGVTIRLYEGARPDAMVPHETLWVTTNPEDRELCRALGMPCSVVSRHPVTPRDIFPMSLLKALSSRAPPGGTQTD